MDAREFDELIARIAQASSRRNAVKGVLGGALAGAGVAAAADAKNAGKGKKGRKAKSKGKKGRRGVASEHNAHNGKRTLCLCQDDGSTTTSSTSTTEDIRTREYRAAQRVQPGALVCETKHFKPRKARKALRDNPGSYRGPCVDVTTTSGSTAAPITSTSTTATSTTATTAQP